jgi:3-oxoacyl-[acyl-carrier-protein] synthase-3
VVKPIGIRILGTGSRFGKDLVYNPSGADAWIRQNLGITARRHVTTETTSDLATVAAMEALEAANLRPLDVDLIIVATTSPDRLAPSTATRVQRNLGAALAFAFDLNAVCSGWLYGLTIAAQFLDTSNVHTALIIGADTFSRFTDWENRDSVFFGDGAGAAVVQIGTGKFWSYLRSDGEGWDSWTIPGGASEYPAEPPIWEMVGKDVYDKAVEAVPDVVRAIVSHAGYTTDDIDWFVPHQASYRVLNEIAGRLHIPEDKVVMNLADYGNTAAASMPTALHSALNRFRPGDLIVFGAVGAGWTWGGAALEWT